MGFIDGVQFVCMMLYLAFGWRGLFALALVALGFGTLAFRIAYRLGQRSVAGISPKQYARLRKVSNREVREEPATLVSAIEREIASAERLMRTRRGDDEQGARR